MARNKKMADALAKNYFHSKKRIEELRAKYDELHQRNKTEKSAELLSENMKIVSQINAIHKDMDNQAHLIVEYLYGEGEEDAKQDGQ